MKNTLFSMLQVIGKYYEKTLHNKKRGGSVNRKQIGMLFLLLIVLSLGCIEQKHEYQRELLVMKKDENGRLHGCYCDYLDHIYCDTYKRHTTNAYGVITTHQAQEAVIDTIKIRNVSWTIHIVGDTNNEEIIDIFDKIDFNITDVKEIVLVSRNQIDTTLISFNNVRYINPIEYENRIETRERMIPIICVFLAVLVLILMVCRTLRKNNKEVQ